MTSVSSCLRLAPRLVRNLNKDKLQLCSMRLISGSSSRGSSPAASPGSSPDASPAMGEEAGVIKRRPEPAEADTLMDIGIRNIYTEDHDMLRVTARRFYREIVQPQQHKWEEQGYPDKEFFLEAGRLGLIGLNCPVEDYGMGGDALMASVMWDEGCYVNCSSSVGLNLHSDVVMPYLQHYGTPEQKKKYIPKMVSGEWVGAIAMTEPGAGSDLQGVRTLAKKDGSDWIINGSKCFITNGYTCDFAIVVCRTDTQAKNASKGISLIIVDAGMPGFTKGKPMHKLGLHGKDTGELFFDDVRVPEENVVGDVNRGFYCLMSQLSIERMGVAGNSIAWAEFMFEETRQYLQQRKAFGRTLSDLQAIQHKMADLKTMVCTSRAFFDQCLVAANNNELTAAMASMAKYWTTDTADKVGYDCVQLHGGTGYMAYTDIAKAYMNVRGGSIYGGANEIMKELIARDIFKKR